MLNNEVNHKQLEQVLCRNYEVNIPLFIHGTTGIGKSRTVEKVARDLAQKEGREFVDWNRSSFEKKMELLEMDTIPGHFIFADERMSLKDPSDLKGIPNLEGNVTFWRPNLLYKILSKKEIKGMVFFDEINTSPPTIQTACYQLIYDGAIGETALNPDIRRLAAGNRLEDRANVFEMPAPLKARFCHVTLKIPSIEEWTDWGLENKIDERVLAFLQFKPSYLFKWNAKSNDNAFPNGRTWEYCSTLIKGIKDADATKIYVAESVGNAASIEMHAFMKLSKKYNLEQILANPPSVKQIQDIGIIYSLTSGLAEKYRSDNKRLEQVLKVANHMQAEFSIFLLRMLKSVNEDHFKKSVQTMDIWKDMADKYAKYVLG